MDQLPKVSSAWHGSSSCLHELGGGQDCQKPPPHGLFLGQCRNSLPTRVWCHSLVRAGEHGQGSGMSPLHEMTNLGDTLHEILDHVEGKGFKSFGDAAPADVL